MTNRQWERKLKLIAKRQGRLLFKCIICQPELELINKHTLSKSCFLRIFQPFRSQNFTRPSNDLWKAFEERWIDGWYYIAVEDGKRGSLDSTFSLIFWQIPLQCQVADWFWIKQIGKLRVNIVLRSIKVDVVSTLHGKCIWCNGLAALWMFPKIANDGKRITGYS